MQKTKKIEKMTNEEYEKYSSECQRLDNEIMNTSLLLSKMKDNGKCPFCRSNIDTKNKIRERHIKDMRKYNEFRGSKTYITHIEGNQKWEI